MHGNHANNLTVFTCGKLLIAGFHVMNHAARSYNINCCHHDGDTLVTALIIETKGHVLFQSTPAPRAAPAATIGLVTLSIGRRLPRSFSAASVVHEG